MRTRIGLFFLASLLVVGGCATRSMGERFDDNRLQMRVGRALIAEPRAQRLGVDVDVFDSVVYLTGEVDSEEERSEVERVAAATPGVKGVRNDLQIEGAAPPDEGELSDLAIRSMLGPRLMLDPDAQRRHIDIDVDNGIVTLKGVVASERAKASAERIARGVDGVRDVNNRLRVRA